MQQHAFFILIVINLCDVGLTRIDFDFDFIDDETSYYMGLPRQLWACGGRAYRNADEHTKNL